MANFKIRITFVYFLLGNRRLMPSMIENYSHIHRLTYRQIFFQNDAETSSRIKHFLSKMVVGFGVLLLKVYSQY